MYERSGLSGGLELEVARQSPFELFVGSDCARAIARPIQEPDQLPNRGLVGRRQFCQPDRPAGRGHRVPRRLRSVNQALGRLGRSASEVLSLLVEPALELGNAGDVYAAKRSAPVQLERSLRLPRAQGRLELPYVAP